MNGNKGSQRPRLFYTLAYESPTAPGNVQQMSKYLMWEIKIG